MLRFLLAIDAPQLRQHVRAAIEAFPDMQVAAETQSPLELLLETGRRQADVVVLSAEDPERLPPVATHLFAEYSGVRVVVVAPAGRCAVMYAQEICAEKFADAEFGDLLAVLHRSREDYFTPR
jgi:DNA-binding NarL/FixJ family response regulator